LRRRLLHRWGWLRVNWLAALAFMVAGRLSRYIVVADVRIEAPMSRNLREQWPVLSFYQRFESVVALVLTLIVALIILIALYRLGQSVIGGLLFGMLDPLDPEVFQAVFGEILTLLIALEFNHTLQYSVAREQSIIRTKVVLLIALLAIARKFIILDVHDVSAGHLLGLAAVTLALGVGYWLIRERDDRLPRGS
jgi:uncharacterized membrane protein (DUF373 family)